MSNLRFSQLGMDDGLPSPFVLSSLQDADGLIWLGTTNGLARYDGRHIKSFTAIPHQSNTLSHPVIQSLLEDQARQWLWIGSHGGLDRMDLRTQQSRRISLPPELSARERRVLALAPAADGRVWVAFLGGLYLLDGERFEFSAWPAAADTLQPGASKPRAITAMISDGNGGVWLARGDKLMHIAAGAQRSTEGRSFSTADAPAFRQASANAMVATHLALDATQRLWVGTNGGVQIWRREASGMVADPLAQELQLPRQMVHALLLDREQTMWIGSGEKAVLYRWRPGSHALESFRQIPGVGGSLSSETMASLMQDRTGALWVGTSDAGVNLVDLSGRSFSNYLSIPGDKQSLSSQVVMATLFEDDTHAWVGTYGGGLNHLHIPSGKVRQIALSDMPISHVKALAHDGHGRVWVGGDRGLVLYDPRLGRSQRLNFEGMGGPAVSISALLKPAGSEELWASAAQGLYRIDAQQNIRHYSADPKRPGALINGILDCLLMDREGHLWVGSKGGLQYLERDREQFSAVIEASVPAANGHARPSIHAMRQDAQGRIWLATSQGLFELKPTSTQSATQNGTKDGTKASSWMMKSWQDLPGMPSGGFDSIQDALNGEIWLGSERGLTRVRPEQKIARFFGGQGAFERGFNFGAANRGPDGSLFFGGPGLLRFWPEQLKDNPSAPQLVLSDLLILNRSLLLDELEAPAQALMSASTKPNLSLADLGIEGPLHRAKTLRLGPDQSMVSFELAALHFDRVKLNRYAWMLEGFDKAWIYGQGSLGLATYTNLDPGHYRLLAKAANPDGVWSETQTLLDIEVSPPYWRTWWWRSGVALAAALLLFAMYRRRVQGFQEAKQRLAQEVASRTQQLAAEKQTALEQREVAEKARRDIALLSEIGRQITASLDVEAIQQTLYKHVKELVNATVFGVGLLDWRERVLNFDFVMQRGQAFKPYKRSLDATEQPAVRCALQAEELRIAALSTDNRELIGIQGGGRVQLQNGEDPQVARSGMYVPMLLKGRVMGVISVLSDQEDAFQTSDLDILRTLGAYAAVALDNAEAYKQLQLTQTKLVEQDKLAALGSLVAGVSHELNTPLGNSVLMASTLRDASANFLSRLDTGGLRRSELEQFCQSTVDSAGLLVRSLAQAANLVNSFKQLAVDQTSEQRRQFDLRALCEEVALTLGNRLRKGEHELHLEFADEVRMDSFPGPLGQVLSNLVINALVHGLEGRQHGLLRLQVQALNEGRSKPSVQLLFSDNGCGISSDNLKRIFEPFFTTKLGQGGSGLGLHISYNIVCGVLGGSIEVSSVVNEGTRFTLVLPCVAP
ncbi:two-component regulator propeller domain-containing protein [Paucibacter sp. Y2R2-4]|uniref:two-component regulator propeller domain-containing protein n=1 Tax=Paucibacter sp. Y2R2-4 TaxID=2893553 RepID=UPI0021E3DA07|nr:two-component regulator propeller domain-containing protein [Paucibacter sp. Y2R2-4]MCV2348931.1 GAF domain-containing protein [Paucibacter sp. Y2R2-4]